jgi:hypothetical protein
MTDRILVISSNTEWREALAEEFGLANIAVLPCGIGESRLKRYLSEGCAAAVIEPEWEATAAPGARFAACETLVKQIRDAGREYPVLFLALVPDDELVSIAQRYKPATVVHDKGAAMDRVGVLRQAWEQLSRPATAVLAESATIEIRLGPGTIECEARVGANVISVPREWKPDWGWEYLNTDFRLYDDNPELFKQFWKEKIDAASKALFRSMIDVPGFQSTIEEVKALTKRFGDIHFRFVVPSEDFEHVPFEVIGYGPGNEEYMRYVAPIARKLSLKPAQVLRGIGPLNGAEGRKQGAVLFISSDVSGFLSYNNKTFKGENPYRLGKLKHLDEEREEVLSAYGRNYVHPVDLKDSADPVKAMTDALEQGPWDVIHFAGHSVQADGDREVVLALPDPALHGELKGYSADDFAQRAAAAEARLVILSSCESCSCRSLLRMASFGVPAVVGFRWPADDLDAAKFTPMLHSALYQRKLSLARAFQDALFRLKEEAGGRMTPFSPILLIQPDSWPTYWREE